MGTGTMSSNGHRSGAFGERVVNDRTGSIVWEFALLGPVLLGLVLGAVEVARLMIAITVLNLAASEAARVGLTGREEAGVTRDEQVREAVMNYAVGLIDENRISISTSVFASFEDMQRGEPFIDSNNNGEWDDGEWYSDLNDNGEWDWRRKESDGVGGPGDIVLYEVNYPWRFMVPFMKTLSDGDSIIDLSAQIAIRNEPFPDDL